MERQSGAPGANFTSASMPTRARLSPPTWTDKDVADASHVGPMLDQLSLAPTSFIGDGAYDRGAVSELLARRNPDMSVLVPPCKGAVPGSDAMSSPTQRDRHILEIEERGRMHWQKASGYNRRSKVEASIGRYKRVIGDALKSRADDRRKAEVAIAVKALNWMRA